MFDSLRQRRRPLGLLAMLTLVATGLGAPVDAGEDIVVPDPCSPHPAHVVNPGCLPAATSEPREPGITYPNLVPNVDEVFVIRPFVIENGTVVPTGPPRLFFDTWVQNLGSVPLQLAFDGVEDPETATASQCVSWTKSRICREQRPVGGFSWHAEHTHFHYNEFADYQLRRLGPDGRPDYSDAGLIARSEKVSFCLIDSRQVDPDALPAPFYLTCTPTVEGISPGWTDIYDPSLEGQQLSLEGLTDGRYALVISVDYADRIYETDNSDNVVEATLELSGGVTAVSVVDRHYP